jgi:4-hydroxy-tetrahydrodipicolinate reductase
MASATSRWINQDAGAIAGPAAAGIVITSDPAIAIRKACVAVSFTLADATQGIASACLQSGCPLVLGTTGHTPEQHAAVIAAAKTIPVVMASNFNLGVSLLAKLVEMAAQKLGDDFDIEIFEAHHRHKKDAPSGTALTLGQAAAKGRGISLESAQVFERHGNTGPRPRGAIGFSVLRGGDIVGDHTVTFAGIGERLELTHRSTDRMGFAQGALHAARWVIGKRPGLYDMQHVLGFQTT